MAWMPGNFQRALGGYGATDAAGYVYRGLGMVIVVRASPKGHRPPTWALVHLNSGHKVASIKGFVADAFPIASEIAECADWDFNGLDGWRNQTPELPQLVRAIIERNSKRAEFRSGGGDQEIAAQISASRA